MGTIFVGALVAVAMFFALRHIAHNIRDGRSDCMEGDCAGCSSCPRGKASAKQ